MARIGRREIRSFVDRLEPFINHKGSCYGGWRGDRYVVCSYRDNYPIYVYTEGRWFGHGESVSRTTSCHKGQAHPSGEVMSIPAPLLRILAQEGFAAMMAARIKGGLEDG